jgi:hypothetical protein
MLYKQLQRINQLDQQIHDMHAQLAEYYRERAALTGNTSPVEQASPTPIKKVTTKKLYDEIESSWLQYGIALPKYDSLKARLKKASDVMASLIADNPQLAGNLHLIAVPPQKQLDQLMTYPSPLKNHYLFTEDYQAHKRATGWNIVVITGPEFSLPIDKLNDSLGKDDFTYKSYDCRGLGVREAIAATIQDIEVVTDNNWTLLLKDATSTSYIPCVTKQDNKLVFEVDDASCLLGNNYVQPAILIK